MTREEILHGLRSIAAGEGLYDDRNPSRRASILGEAIKAIEQEPCEDCVSRQAVDRLVWEYLKKGTDENIAFYEHFLDLPSVTPQESKIKVLDRDEVIRKLGAVDIYQANAWITLLNDLEHLELKICEVE